MQAGRKLTTEHVQQIETASFLCFCRYRSTHNSVIVEVESAITQPVLVEGFITESPKSLLQVPIAINKPTKCVGATGLGNKH